MHPDTKAMFHIYITSIPTYVYDDAEQAVNKILEVQRDQNYTHYDC